jgi:hypothetical protein
MKRSYFFAVLGGAALVVAAACSDGTGPEGRRSLVPSHASLGIVTGAVTTTTNPQPAGPDDPGHCKNGNEAVNCNIYDGKEFVWLSGLENLGDGTYFFAVLAPGGQGGGANPNDGTEKNLSDDVASSGGPGSGDHYTNRTFSKSGTTITYGGSHDFDDNKIRLMPYDDTPNPGGVYIMAVCSLTDLNSGKFGSPGVDPSSCKYDAFKVKVGECPECGGEAAGAEIETEVHLEDHTPISNSSPATLGSTVHDKGTVTTTDASDVPDGSFLRFYFWENNDCTGNPAKSSPPLFVDGTSPQSVDDALPQGPLAAGEYCYQAFFTSGDPSAVNDGDGAPEPFKVSKADVSTSTDVHDAKHNVITNGTVATGSYVHDKATVGPKVDGITIGGTVTFSFFTNGTCTDDPQSTETVDVGTESTPIQINTPGSYAYSAKYNGDDNYNASDGSDCEPFSVVQLGLTMGFWGNKNGVARIVAAGGYAANAVAIGRGSNIDTQAEALKVLPNTLNACGKGTPFIFTVGAQTASKDCTLATGINVGTLNTNSSQTLALGYNIKLVSGFTGETIGALLCSAYVTAGLTSASTVNQAFSAAVGLIDGSASGGGTTQAQLGAMNQLLGCLNREAL